MGTSTREKFAMPFKKFVEIGRVAVLGGEGPNQGKIAAIVNVIDQNRVLVDGPTRIVRAELVANKVDETWANSTWAKRMAVKAKRAGLTDLDRFKLRKAKSARNKILARALNSKKRTLRKAGKL